MALNKADTAAETAAQAKADAQQDVTDVQAAISSANTANSAANTATIAANSAAASADQAAQNAGNLYQMVNPLTGRTTYVTDIIDSLTAYILRDAVTARQIDDLTKLRRISTPAQKQFLGWLNCLHQIKLQITACHSMLPATRSNSGRIIIPTWPQSTRWSRR